MESEESKRPVLKEFLSVKSDLDEEGTKGTDPGERQ